MAKRPHHPPLSPIDRLISPSTVAELKKRQYEQLVKEGEKLALVMGILADADAYQASFKLFVKAAWPTIEPGRPFQDNWHLDCLTEHLEACAKRQIRRLIINIAPRSLKSTIISVAFPAWRWLTDPAEKFLCASYSKAIVLRDSRRTRNLIASQWFQTRYASKFALAADQNEKGRFENDKGGTRVIASVEGGILGEGGSCLLLDDCNDLNEMPSETYEQNVRDWYSGSVSSRFIDPNTDIRICIQQRAPYGNDLTAYLLELGNWEQLSIPYEYDGNKRVSSIGWTDPRTVNGELMFPARLGLAEVEKLKIEQKANWSGQFNQKPVTDGSESLRREWFNFYNPPGTERVDERGQPIPVVITAADGSITKKIPVTLPTSFEQLCDSWDCAYKDADHNDYVAGHQWGRRGANTYLLAREHGHFNFPQTVAAIKRMAERGAPEKLVEDKANGPAVIQVLQNEVPGLIPINPEGGKFARVAAISGYVEAGNVYLPNPDLFPWVWELLKEFAEGRAARHDDDTDAMTQALMRLYNSLARSGVPEFRIEPRFNEPVNACHVVPVSVDPTWRRYVVIVPSRAALLMAETHTGSLRVLGEIDLDRVDATTAGQLIGKSVVPSLPVIGQRAYDLILPKEAFAPVEPVGSYAELLEAALLAYVPDIPDWDRREAAKLAIRNARFRSEMVELEDAALDRLRSLLAFQPPDFRQLPYDRRRALELARQDLHLYSDYMAAVEGEVSGEWPKLRIDPSCRSLVSQLGTYRTDIDPPAFVECLLYAVCVPRTTKDRKVVELPVGDAIRALQQKTAGGRSEDRKQRVLGRKFMLR